MLPLPFNHVYANTVHMQLDKVWSVYIIALLGFLRQGFPLRKDEFYIGQEFFISVFCS